MQYIKTYAPNYWIVFIPKVYACKILKGAIYLLKY